MRPIEFKDAPLLFSGYLLIKSKISGFLIAYQYIWLPIRLPVHLSLMKKGVYFPYTPSKTLLGTYQRLWRAEQLQQPGEVRLIV